jgi:hypothetical protein
LWVRRDSVWLEPAPGTPAAAEAAAAAAAASSSEDGAGNGTVWIMRGLPGSGKSTRAAAIAAAAAPDEAVIHSTDTQFVDPATGVYTFDAARLPEAHAANLAAFERSLDERVPCVVIDNTNIQPWHYEKYVLSAWRAGYRVREEVVGDVSADGALAEAYAARNVHGVPADKIAAMASAWQAG